MSEQELEDRVLLAVRRARPATDDAAVSPTSADALKVLERVLQGEEARRSFGDRRTRVRRWRRPAIRQLLRPRVGAIVTAAAAAVIAAVLVLSGVSGGPSLLDRAYAAISARYQVLHEVDVQYERTPRGYSDRVEGWLLPATGQARVVGIWGYRGTPFVDEWIITASGQAFSRGCLKNCHPASFINGRAPWAHVGHGDPATFVGFPGTLPGTFAKLYRAAYRDHAIVEDGTATFGGRHVARLQSMTPTFGAAIIFWRPGTPPPPSARKNHIGGAPYSLVTWYVDPATAQPVGFTSSPCAGGQIRSCGRPAITTHILTFERLDPTAQNLALLTGPHAPAAAR